MIEEQIADPLPRNVLTISRKPYYSQPEGCNLCVINWMRCADVIDGFGGSVYRNQTRGAEFEFRGAACYLPTVEELKTIKAAYCEAYEAHKVKVDRYIKRYGTSKVHAWTYWGEA